MGHLNVIVVKGLRVHTCPKVATASIELATHGAYPRHTSCDEPGDEYRWMCIRHPLDRLVSCWAFFCKADGLHGQGALEAIGYYSGMSFSDFLDVVLVHYSENQHTQLQADFVGPYPVNFCRFDNLFLSWELLRKRFPFLRSLTVKHKSDHNPWETYYTPEQRSRAERVYSADIDLYEGA